MPRPIGNYEIRFAVSCRQRDWCGLPPMTVSKTAREAGIVDCAIVLPAYTAEDVLVDFWTRLLSYGWQRESILIESVAPTREDRPMNF